MLSKKAIKAYIRAKTTTKEGKNFMLAGDVWETIDDKIKRLLDDACARTDSGNRVIVMKHDL